MCAFKLLDVTAFEYLCFSSFSGVSYPGLVIARSFLLMVPYVTVPIMLYLVLCWCVI